MKVAAIYRVSTEKQVRREGEESLPVQRTAVRAFIAGRPGWSLVQEYAEEGVSGFKRSADERDVLQQAFHDARAGRWQALVVFKADRLSRNALEYPLVIDRFRRIGCEVWSVADSPGGRLLALDTQMDKFVRFLEGWQAETESKNTSIRVSEAMLQLARQGRWSGGPVPYGYRLNEARRRGSDQPSLLIDPQQAKVIQMMVKLYLDDRLGCKRIAGELNRAGIHSPSGRPWDDQRIRRILQNPLIAGLPAYNRTRAGARSRAFKSPYDLSQFVLPRDEQGELRPIPEYQIVPLAQWLTLMAAMRSNRSAQTGGEAAPVAHGSRAADGALTGLLYCAHCGARLSASVGYYKVRRQDGTSARSRRGYYVCSTHLHRGREFCSGQRTYGRRRLEAAVFGQLEQLLGLMDPAELLERMGGALANGTSSVAEQRRSLAQEMARSERVLAGWLERMDHLLAAPDESPFTEEMLTGKIRGARDRLAELQQRVRELDGVHAGPSPEQVERFGALAPHWWACFRQAASSEQRLMLRELIERITVGRTEVEIQFRVDLESFLPKAGRLVAANAAVSERQRAPRLYLVPSR